MIDIPATPQRHSGPERRHAFFPRSTHGDRRHEIRYEPDQSDRRSGQDRRRQGGWDAIGTQVG